MEVGIEIGSSFGLPPLVVDLGIFFGASDLHPSCPCGNRWHLVLYNTPVGIYDQRSRAQRLALHDRKFIVGLGDARCTSVPGSRHQDLGTMLSPFSTVSTVNLSSKGQF